MKAVRNTLMLMTLACVVVPLAAQVDPDELGRLDSGIAVLEATHKRVAGELAAIEQGMASPEVVVWPTANGWASAPTSQLIDEVAFVQLAATRPDGKDRTGRIAGLTLPAELVEAAKGSPDRPAKRLVREWAEAHGAEHQEATAALHRKLKRTAKMTESWLAEYRAQRQAATQPVSGSPAYPQGACYVPPGKWQIGSSPEVLDVAANGYFVTATKTRGSRQVPAGKINFYVHPRTCDAGLQNAEEGYTNPFWVRSRVQVRWIEPGKQFAIQWPERAETVYTLVE